jgi:hypothetical protein
VGEKGRLVLCLLACLVFAGCATYHRRGLDEATARHIAQEASRRSAPLPREQEDRILALDPERLTLAQIRDVLSNAPAPHIANIHGGIFPVHTRMISFSKFLIGLGYPEVSLTNPADGTYTFSCYENSKKVAGMLAWFYEKEGLRPMMVGHSQGGMQTVKVLYHLAGLTSKQLKVWNPVTWKPEPRTAITDPLTGKPRAVVGLDLCFATVTGAGGLARILPNQWDTCGRLRKIPDSVDEFTGFYKHKDLLGGDYLGYGPANHYKAMGRAKVRTVELPSYYKHGRIPDTRHLLQSRQIVDWIDAYDPAHPPASHPTFDADSRHILWAADVWHSIKRHWVLELQRLIRARRASTDAP